MTSGGWRVVLGVILAPLLASGVEVADVDTSIGAIATKGYGGHGLGKTFPGACVPFGMVQLSPDTITGGDNGPGYSYHHPTIEGFSFTHLSGIGWYGDLGNIQVQPGLGPMRYFHPEETTQAGFYEVLLRDAANTNRPICRVAATALEDLGVLRFRYAVDAPRVLTLDLSRRIGELRRPKRFSEQRLDFLSDREFTGVIRCDHRDGGWGHGEGGVDYTVYFHAVASSPLVDRVQTGGNTNLFLTARFGGEPAEVTLAVRISYAGVPAAPTAADCDFGRTRDAARGRWTDALGAISVEGGTRRQHRTFATALYHALIDPRRLDGAPLPNGHVLRRTVFSGWDVFRSEMPLLCLIRPDDVAETIDAMCETVRSGARETLPRWDLFACPGGCMIGNPLIPVMLTADDCGIPLDRREMLRLAAATARTGNDAQLGYSPDSLSKTLEYAYADWCVARLAERAGDDALRREFDARAQWYRNVWDPSVGWMRTRTRNGGWLRWKGETVHRQGTVESNPLQQGWFVPHDVEGLIALVGGRERFVAKLEDFFARAPDDFLWGDYYNHPNEPSHHVPFLFAKAGRPELASYWTRRILDRAYSDTVRGLCGNDDVGQMSAWYVLAALGISPMCPGSGEWILTAPLFPKAAVRFPARGMLPASELVIERRGEGTRIIRIELNGSVISSPWLTTSQLLSGGRLIITTSP